MAAREHYPRGTVAFLFTDIEGSTRLWQRHRPAMERAYARHDAVLRAAVADQDGVVYKVVGDALQAAFPAAERAVAAALEAQLGIDAEDWTGMGLPEPLRVRTALHAGAVDPDPDGDYRSPVLNRLGRLLGAGHGGQVLLSQAVAQLTRDRLPEESSLRDLGEHRLKDLLEPEHLFQLVHPALETDFPAPRTLDVVRHNLPVQPTRVIGREREVGKLTEMLRRPEVRLVTLTGPGGTGKTRLALQAAAELLEDFADGVWFVPLAALSDPTLVPSSIAEALGVRESGGTPLRELLADYLREKRLLLVLDNFEHVLEAAPAVGELLAAPHVSVLVTSRAPLRLRGEKEVAVPPLGLPKRKPPPTAEQLSQYAAVRLFIERAQDVRADFAVDSANAPAIAEICHRLDGLPLAIELAAARVKMLPPQAMLARLEQRLPLLTGGARDLPARQQTLRAAIAWSDDLLTDDERKLYRRLAVFAGGWTLEAAEAVAGSPHSGELGLEVFDGLSRLVDHSLVRQVEGAADEDRFAMLETIREYGLEQLEAGGEAEEAHQRHAAFFLEIAETAEPKLRSAAQHMWLDRLETEHDNLRAALTWSIGQRDTATALRLGAALWGFWWRRGYLNEGRRWLEGVLTLPSADGASARARALLGASLLTSMQADFALGEALAEAARDLARSTGDHTTEAHALLGLSMAVSTRDTGRATLLTEEALGYFREVADPWGIAIALLSAGIELEASGEVQRAIVLMEEGLAFARQTGDQNLLSMMTGNIGSLWLVLGHYDRAGLMLEEAESRARGTGDRRNIAYVMHCFVDLALRQNDIARAVVTAREALSLFRELGDRLMVVTCMESIACAAGMLGHLHHAARHAGAASNFLTQLDARLPTATLPVEQRLNLQRRMGSETFTESWEAGRALSLDEAVAEALALADELAQLAPGGGAP